MITLTGVQEDLVRDIMAVQPNTVVVFISGSSIASTYITESVPSILQSFYPGELGGPAIIDILLGEINPSGKLPLTMYYPNITSRDIRNMDLSSEGGITHSWFNGSVLFPFGWGLSYTSFTYVSCWSDGLEEKTLSVVEDFNVSQIVSLEITVTNTGTVWGDCVIFMFISRENQSLLEPKQSLLDFIRLRKLVPGESRKHVFSLSMADSTTRDIMGFYLEKQWQPRRNSVYQLRLGDVASPAVLTLKVN